MAKGTGSHRFALIVLVLLSFLSACASQKQPVKLSPQDLAEADALLVSAAANGEKRRVQLLLSAGARVNARDSQGYTPVMRAAANGHLSVVKVLLSAGANVNVSQGGESLLMKVVAGGDLLTAEMLLSAGADVNYRSASGKTALDVARANNSRDLEMLLVQAGASL
ncbi:ankyrin repeat domain-containing protein [Marinobacter subterrani]|uniref:ankyrin repeat domain-containing protein n=1 Tax=Marinobacter subterrani TaxID=1658765 RepID=UPI002357963F|nr:ankyrin repeat domain-containing protein [Marinobacter subterrani]